MSVVIEGYDKPKDCYVCPFDRHGCWCSITNGVIDRDDYSCDKPCPIKSLDNVLDEIKAKIEGYRSTVDYAIKEESSKTEQGLAYADQETMLPAT